MALSDDQRAMLRLLAQREQGYEDMAALMGVSVEELRSRVNAALAQLEREGEAPPPLPEPPAAAEPASEPASPPPAAAEPQAAPPPPEASPEPPELSATPPSGSVPPSLPPSDPRAAGDGGRRGRGTGGFSLSSNGTRVALGAIAGAVVIVVVLLLVLGGGSDSDSTSTGAESNPATSAESPSAETPASPVLAAEEETREAAAGGEVTSASLRSPSDESVRGFAAIVRVQKRPLIQLIAEGLEQLGQGETYAIWIAQSPQKMLPVAEAPVSAEGQFAGGLPIPAEVLSYLATDTFDEIAITRASKAKLRASLKEATKAKEAPKYTGTSVLRGKITGPLVGAAKRLEEEKEGEESGPEGEEGESGGSEGE